MHRHDRQLLARRGVTALRALFAGNTHFDGKTESTLIQELKQHLNSHDADGRYGAVQFVTHLETLVSGERPTKRLDRKRHKDDDEEEDGAAMTASSSLPERLSGLPDRASSHIMSFLEPEDTWNVRKAGRAVAGLPLGPHDVVTCSTCGTHPVRILHLRFECYVDAADGVVVLRSGDVKQFTNKPAEEQTAEYLTAELRKQYDVDINSDVPYTAYWLETEPAKFTRVLPGELSRSMLLQAYRTQADGEKAVVFKVGGFIHPLLEYKLQKQAVRSAQQQQQAGQSVSEQQQIRRDVEALVNFSNTMFRVDMDTFTPRPWNAHYTTVQENTPSVNRLQPDNFGRMLARRDDFRYAVTDGFTHAGGCRHRRVRRKACIRSSH